MTAAPNFGSLITASKELAKAAERRNQLATDATPNERVVTEEAIVVAFSRLQRECDRIRVEAKLQMSRQLLRRLYTDHEVIGVIAHTANPIDPKGMTTQWNITEEVRRLAVSAS